jgi:Thioredoxin like C-terminal domain
MNHERKRGHRRSHAGNGAVSHTRMHHLIRQTAPIADRQFEIESLAPGVELFAFTFG